MNTVSATKSASASPVTPDAEAKAVSWKIAERVANDWCANDTYRGELLDEITAALTAYAMREREACAQIVEKMNTATAYGLAAAIRARSAQSKEGK